MFYVIIGLSLLFAAIGFIITEKNAKYLLSGYNTMSEEARQQFDLKGYLALFRKFHLFLGASLLIIGLPISYTISESAGGVFIAIYPIVAYIYFTVVSARFSKGKNTKQNKIGLVVLIITLLFVFGLLGYGYKENKLIFDTEKIEITGAYGETWLPAEIQSIGITDKLPAISYKSNGFALGDIRKGNFKTKAGETVKLMLNSANKPYLIITKTNGKKVYFSAKKGSTSELFNKLKNTLPEIEYKQ